MQKDCKNTTETTRESLKKAASDLLNAPSACAEAKTAAQNWLDAASTDEETEQTRLLLAESEADIMPIDSLIAFADSDMGAKVFGAEAAKQIAAHAKDNKAKGAKYCDCPACAACAAILALKSEI